MQFSIEVLPSQTDKFIQAYQTSSFATDLEPSSLFVLVPHINGKPYTAVMMACETLIDQGFQVIPHLGVRNLNHEDDLSLIHSFLQNKTQSVLLLGGDNDKPERFSSVIEFMKNQWTNDSEATQIPVSKIYFSVFPEGHPHVGKEQGEQELIEKVQWVNNQGIPCGCFTQICLEASPIVTQCQQLINVDVEFYASFVAPCKISQLIKLAAISGVKNAMGFLKKHNMFKMLSTYDSDTLIDQVLRANNIPDGLHCYAFGNYQGALEKLCQYSKAKG